MAIVKTNKTGKFDPIPKGGHVNIREKCARLLPVTRYKGKACLSNSILQDIMMSTKYNYDIMPYSIIAQCIVK